MTNAKLTGCLLAGVLALASASASAQTIKKCKDADGTWHYGDFAAAECERSKITELSETGMKVDEQGLPPTREELRAEQERQRRQQDEKQTRLEQTRRDNMLLMTYESEQSILSARDQRLQAIDAYIEANRGFVDRLRDQLAELEARAKASSLKKPERAEIERQIDSTLGQITEYEMATDVKMQERTAIEQRYADELSRYRDALARRQNRGAADS